MKRKTASLLNDPRRTRAALVMALAVIAAGSAAAETLDVNQQVSIAVAGEPPYTELKPDGTLSGAGPDIDRRSLELSGLKNFKGELIPYGAQIPAVQAKRVKVLSSGSLNIRPERCTQVNFAEPAICTSQAFLIRSDMAGKFKSYKDFAALGLKLGAGAGTLQAKDAMAAGVKKENVIPYPDTVSAVKMLQDKRIDAIALNDAGVIDMKKRSGDETLQVVMPIENTPIDCAAAAFNKDDTALRDAYNAGYKKLKDSGEYEKIMAKYGLESNYKLLASAKSAAEMCSPQ
ncbi:ectoine/hydroxyectoine ABC transporter substrate-binding protein EhuB [Microvirga sp. VF16]|uniref:ectoine/hydroxyectoine ABC transporter substrate-binding protein EhuB n=1 Tax=Microvirga sp. VF16 TaxID=2807101 RepID=UPI00193D70AD|nr:ectoine/hydroxyectoine ABC transporter substrate-binding protein EhuB [Microvirga sp. VF16]QRM32177.1 ectoine/hydroxyectoine ABC transporter substrate-binding protein EhuB [Microvirga sp. VF16]